MRMRYANGFGMDLNFKLSILYPTGKWKNDTLPFYAVNIVITVMQDGCTCTLRNGCKDTLLHRLKLNSNPMKILFLRNTQIYVENNFYNFVCNRIKIG